MWSSRKLFLSLIIVLVMAFGAGSLFGAPIKRIEFHDAMRTLWIDHVVWTRLFIVSAAGDLPDKKPVTTRLLANQKDIGDAMRPFYGDAAGEKLTSLLTEHITIAAELVEAAKMKNSEKKEAASGRWSANANDIAKFLSEANPSHWSADEMKAMMEEHLELTMAEVAARLKGDWKEDIATYKKVQDQALRMADMLSDGVIAQFPQHFAEVN